MRDVVRKARFLVPEGSRHCQTPEYYWSVGVCGLDSVVGRASLIIVGRVYRIVFVLWPSGILVLDDVVRCMCNLEFVS